MYETKIHINKHQYYKKDSFLFNPHSVPRWMLYAVEKGKFSYVIDKESGIASEGDLVFCPPMVMFDRTVIEPLRFHLAIFDWRDPNDTLLHNMNYIMRFLPAYRLSIQDHNRFYSTIQNLRKICQSRLPVNLDLIGHYMNDLWVQAQMEIQFEKFSDKNNEDVLMDRVKQTFDELACGKISCNNLAANYQLSASQLTRRFQASFGITPVAYITYVRLQKAKSYLEKTDYTIEHIAELCGYDNPFYFSKVFSNYYKLPPSQYRKLNHS
jgi:AraC-like DNA-binding protein